MVILAATMFKILSTQNTVKGYTPGKKLFGCDTIILIGHNEDWQLIHHEKQTQINYDNSRKNRKRVDYDYKVGNNIMLKNKKAYKYRNPYKGTYKVIHMGKPDVFGNIGVQDNPCVLHTKSGL